MNVLDGLEAVNWNSLNTMSGDASQIPKLLRDLTSVDKVIREDALVEIQDEIMHQTSTFDSAPFVLHFILELLSTDNVDKRRLIDFISLIAFEGSCKSKADASDLQTTDDEIFLDVFQRARMGIPLYIALANDIEDIRLEVIYLLSLFHTDTFVIVPYLLSLAEQEKNPHIKSICIWAVWQLASANGYLSNALLDKLKVFLVECLNDTNQLLVRFASSEGLIRIFRENVPEEAIVILSMIIQQSELLIYLPWDDVPLWSACQTLSQLPKEKAITVLLNVLDGVKKPKDAHYLVSALLNLSIRGEAGDLRAFSAMYTFDHTGKNFNRYSAYSNEQFVIPKPLTNLQKHVLTSVVRTESFWQIESNLLEMYGLPITKEHLQQLIDAKANQ